MAAGESSDQQPASRESDQATVAGRAADDESQSGSNDGSLMTGGVVLIGFLVIAALIFFGRRFLGRE